MGARLKIPKVLFNRLLPSTYVVIFIVNSSSRPHDVGDFLKEQVVISLNYGHAVFLKLEGNKKNY